VIVREHRMLTRPATHRTCPQIMLTTLELPSPPGGEGSGVRYPAGTAEHRSLTRPATHGTRPRIMLTMLKLPSPPGGEGSGGEGSLGEVGNPAVTPAPIRTDRRLPGCCGRRTIVRRFLSSANSTPAGPVSSQLDSIGHLFPAAKLRFVPLVHI